MGKRKLSNIQQNWNERVGQRVSIPDNSSRVFVKDDSVKLSCTVK